jgi:hypothetical protein
LFFDALEKESNSEDILDGAGVEFFGFLDKNPVPSNEIKSLTRFWKGLSKYYSTIPVGFGCYTRMWKYSRWWIYSRYSGKSISPVLASMNSTANEDIQ